MPTYAISLLRDDHETQAYLITYLLHLSIKIALSANV